MTAFASSSAHRPTTYNGVNFRSELEASWDAFFHLRGTPHEYRPLLDLNLAGPGMAKRKGKGSLQIRAPEARIAARSSRMDRE